MYLAKMIRRPFVEAEENGESGFALLIVVITLTTLSLIVGGALYLTRSHVKDVGAAIENERFKAALDGGIATMAERLSFGNSDLADAIHSGGEVHIGNIDVKILVRPENAKLNLNVANAATLTALFQISGLSAQQSETLTDQILDWRDPDTTPRLHGAEEAEYISAGRHYSPSNKKFETISELAFLLSGNTDFLACVEPDITVYGDTADIDFVDASPRLQAALKSNRASDARASIVAATAVTGTAVYAGRIFEIEETAIDPETGSSRYLRVQLRATGDPRQAVKILSSTDKRADSRIASAACHKFASENPL